MDWWACSISFNWVRLGKTWEYVRFRMPDISVHSIAHRCYWNFGTNIIIRTCISLNGQNFHSWEYSPEKWLFEARTYESKKRNLSAELSMQTPLGPMDLPSIVIECWLSPDWNHFPFQPSGRRQLPGIKKTNHVVILKSLYLLCRWKVII
jgi:hypothetical protein